MPSAPLPVVPPALPVDQPSAEHLSGRRAAVRRRRLAAVAGLAALAALTLGGCGRLEADLTVNISNTTDGTIVLAVPDAVATALGEDPAALWKQVTAQDDLAARIGSTASSAPYHADGFTGTKITLHATPLAALDQAATTGDAGNQSLSITREKVKQGDQFVVAAHLDLSPATLAGLASGGTSDAAAAASAAAAGDIRLSLTFPGKVVSADGAGTSFAGNTVTWHSEDGTLDAHARAWASNQGTREPWYVFALPGLVLVTIISLAVATGRRNRRRAASGER